MKTITKFLAVAVAVMLSMASGFSQTDYAACGALDLEDRAIDSVHLLADGSGNITSNQTLTNDKIWILKTKIYVTNGATLTIEAGAVIKATVGVGLAAPALIITRGADIQAVGTESCPIIFTSVEDDLDGTYPAITQGKWGGVILLGYGYCNLVPLNEFGVTGPGEGTIEGLDVPDERHHYGRDWDTLPDGSQGALVQDFIPNDNSGRMEYVSIRHGGAEIGTANEINGLTCGGVGSQTILRNIEIVSNQDDGIEFFGGSVDIQYATVLFCDDDYVDWDLGYKGRGQFLFGVQLPAKSPLHTHEGDNGLEIDGDDDDAWVQGWVTDPDSLSDPVFYNVTMIGNGRDEGIEAKELTRGTIVNSIFANFGNGLNLANEGDRNPDVIEYWMEGFYDSPKTDGKFVVKNSTFLGMTGNCLAVQGDGNLAGSDTLQRFWDYGNLCDSSETGTLVDPDGLDYVLDYNAVDNVTVSGYDAVPDNGTDLGIATSMAAPGGGFFLPANYRGAFIPGYRPWTDTWTYGELLGMDNAIFNCPTDIDGDGDTDIDDFLKLLPEFDSQCGR